MFQNLRVSMIATMLCIVTPTSSVSSQDIGKRVRELIDSRTSINSFYAVVTLQRTMPEKIVSKYVVASQGDAFRFDRERVEFAIDRSEEGKTTRQSVVGSETRINHSEYGAQLDRRSARKQSSVDLRQLGLHLASFSELSPDKYRGSTSFVKRVADDLERIEVRKVEGVECTVATSIDESGKQRSIFFERGSGKYRGCELIVEDSYTRCWVIESVVVSDVDFPVQLRFWKGDQSGCTFEELLSVSGPRFNSVLPEDTFGFSGLGVRAGQPVTIRVDPNTSGLKDLSEMYWDGSQLVDSQLLVGRAFWTFPRLLGMICVFCGSVAVIVFLRQYRSYRHH